MTMIEGYIFLLSFSNAHMEIMHTVFFLFLCLFCFTSIFLPVSEFCLGTSTYPVMESTGSVEIMVHRIGDVSQVGSVGEWKQ